MIWQVRRTLCAAAAGFALVVGAAHAQTVVPGSAQPGLLERRFDQPELPKATEEEIRVPERAGAAPPEGADQATFVLKGLVVDGATVYQQADFLPLYEKLLGSQVSVKTLYDIAAAITAKYAADGYVLSQALVPAQKINGNGLARIQVVEGYVDKVIIKGQPGGPEGLLKEYGDKIRASRPLRLKDLERYLLLAGDLPGSTASGTLKPSETVSGAADLIFEVGHKPVDAFATLDNRGSKYVGPWQTSAGLNLNSLLGLYERTSLQVASTPFQPEELKYGRLAHEESVGSEGTKVSADAGYSVSHPGFTLKPSAVRSHSRTLGAGVSHPFIRSRAENLTLRGRAEAKDTSTDQYVDQQISEDRIRVLRGGGSYDWVDTTLVTPAVSIVAFELSQGFDALGARRTGSAGLSKAQGHSDFFKVTADVNRVQRLYPGISLSLGMTGQWAASSLLSSEQFSFGGSQFGRGYDPAELTGDHGIAGKAELQYAGPEVPLVKDWQLYAFYDIGKMWLANPNASDAPDHGAASTGLGVRSNLTESVSLNLELAKPLTHAVAVHEERGHDWRGFFGLVARY